MVDNCSMCCSCLHFSECKKKSDDSGFSYFVQCTYFDKDSCVFSGCHWNPAVACPCQNFHGAKTSSKN